MPQPTRGRYPRTGLGIHYVSEPLPSCLVNPCVPHITARFLAPNPFFSGSGNPFFPDKCLGHGCAKWAVESSVEFADAFFSRMGIVPRHERFKPLDAG